MDNKVELQLWDFNRCTNNKALQFPFFKKFKIEKNNEGVESRTERGKKIR